jgi:hypothetical protein
MAVLSRATRGDDMSTIIAGGFAVATDADAAVRRLQAAGVSLDHICTFRVNPPGEHHKLPAGGDHDASPAARNAHSGAAKGAAIGAAVGLAAGAAATPLLGPAGVAAGVGVGAYAGSLVGGLKEIDSEPQPGHEDVRPAENLVAVNADAAGITEDAIARLFEELGALQIERAFGRWERDSWADFDATRTPNVIGGRTLRTPGNVEDRPAAPR